MAQRTTQTSALPAGSRAEEPSQALVCALSALSDTGICEGQAHNSKVL